MDVDRLARSLEDFAAERDWQQFHTPKNLAMALMGEAGELGAEFQWLELGDREELGTDGLQRVERELADVQIYLIRLADRLGVDLETAVLKKLEANAEAYPAEKSRGHARKYTQLD